MESDDISESTSSSETRLSQVRKGELDKSIDTVYILIDSLSEEEEESFCNENLSLNLEEHTITVKLFGKLLSIAERNASNHNEAINNMLCSLNPVLKEHNLHVLNIVRKYQHIIKKAETVKQKKQKITI